ncbi:MaoC family dehydratase N-terminal domain-containing protein [Chloroflexota bacterium]
MLPEDITELIGKDEYIVTLEVEKGAIRKFADAVDDKNPLYWDEEYARNSRHGSIIAPPGFFGWPAKWPREGPLFSEVTTRVVAALARAGYSRTLDGGMEYEFFRAIQAGDTLIASSMVKDIVAREGRTAKMAFVITETTYTNQNGDLVAKARGTTIHR